MADQMNEQKGKLYRDGEIEYRSSRIECFRCGHTEPLEGSPAPIPQGWAKTTAPGSLMIPEEERRYIALCPGCYLNHYPLKEG